MPKATDEQKEEFRSLTDYPEFDYYSSKKKVGVNLRNWLRSAGEGTRVRTLYDGNWINFTKEGKDWTASRAEGYQPKDAVMLDVSNVLDKKHTTQDMVYILAKSAMKSLAKYAEK